MAIYNGLLQWNSISVGMSHPEGLQSLPVASYASLGSGPVSQTDWKGKNPSGHCCQVFMIAVEVAQT